MLKRMRSFLVLVMLFITVTMSAQVTTATMSGKVTAQDEPIIGATIVAVHEPSGTRYGTVTNVSGQFNLQGMRTGGPYKVEISYVGYQKGWLQSKHKADYTAMQNEQRTFQVTTPGYYTVCVKDGVGNTYLAYQYVELWKDLWSVKPFDSESAENYEGAMEDRWGNSVTNPIRVAAREKGDRYIEYSLDGKYTRLSGEIIRSEGIDDSENTWIQIIADGVLIYQSPKMNYKTKPVSFDIAINRAKYVKIVAYSDEYGQGNMLITNAKLYN